ncbi:MAG: ferritin-like domain-containing protein [Pontimonas sp.]
MNTQRSLTTTALLAGSALLALTLAGCQVATDQTEEQEFAAEVAETEESGEERGLDEGEQDDYSTSDLAMPDWKEAAPEEGTDAFLAWEALMGPEGEYAALASYQAVLDEFGDVEPYATIMQAEARHAEALSRQLERMGVEVPENPYLGLLDAPADLTSAAEAWAAGEIANVELYDELIAQATDDNLIRVFENLRRASLEQHLPAFEAAAENGGTLDPEDMTGLQMMHRDGRGGHDDARTGEGQMRQRGQQQESRL